jgi:tRNA 2-thiouridine synthesizing protein A
MSQTVLDTTGLRCPLPVLKAKKALAALAPGATLKIISTDPGSIADFEVFCGIGGHALLATGETGGVYTIEIRRGG